MIYSIGFGLIATWLALEIYTALSTRTPLNPYLCWIGATSIITFGYYGADKLLSKAEQLKIRIPENILNLLSLIGGFPGAWVGRFVWDHKSNIRKHLWMFGILLLSTLLHGVYFYYSFVYQP